MDPAGEHRQDEVPRRHRDHYATLAVLVQSGGLEKAGRPASPDAGMPGNRADRRSDERSGDARAPGGTWCRISTFDFSNITRISSEG
jgi:hypothetical protein